MIRDVYQLDIHMDDSTVARMTWGPGLELSDGHSSGNSTVVCEHEHD